MTITFWDDLGDDISRGDVSYQGIDHHRIIRSSLPQGPLSLFPIKSPLISPFEAIVEPIPFWHP
jgi:hypothetical protein